RLPDARLQVRDLGIGGDVVAENGAGKGALGTERQLLERDVPARLIDAPFEIVGAFHVAALGGHQAEDDFHALGHEAQRSETARPWRVVFKKKTVELEFVEQNLRHRIVAALGGPGAAEVAAADMHTHGHVGRTVFDTLVNQFGIGARQLVGVFSDLAHALAHFFVAKVGHVRIIELEIGATEIRQSVDLFAVNARQVRIKTVHVGVRLFVYRRAAATHVQNRRRWDAELRRAVSYRGQILKIFSLNAPAALERSLGIK